MKNRINKIIEKENISATRLAQILKVQRSNISHILSGRNNPSLEFMQKILHNFPNISPAWLIMGEGEMYINKSKHNEEPKLTLFADEESDKVVIENDATKNIITKQTPTEKAPPPLLPTSSAKDVEKIVIFYTDKTFEIFNQP